MGDYGKIGQERMDSVQRYDVGTLDLLHMQTTPEGYILAEGIAARPGVLTYRFRDGSTRRELFPPDEAARADSAATLARKPLTLEHHPEEGTAGIFGPDAIGRVEVGDVDGEIVLDSGFTRVKLAVRRQDAIAFVRSHPNAQLSPGYRCDTEKTSGVWNGQPYDVIQRNRVYNSLALTERGRAGADVCLRTDSDAVMIGDDTAAASNGGQTMTEKDLAVGGKTFRLDATIADGIEEAIRLDAVTHTSAINALKEEMAAKAAEHEKAVGFLKGGHDAEMADLQKRHDELQAKIDAKAAAGGDGEAEPDPEAEAKLDAAEVAAFNKRLPLVALATKHGIADACKTASRTLKRAVADKLGVRTDAADGYLDGALDTAYAAAVKADAGLADVSRIAAGTVQTGTSQVRTDSADPYGANGRAALIQQATATGGRLK